MSYSSELKSLRKMNFQNTQSVQKKSSYQSALDSLRSMDSFPEAQQEQQTVAPAPSAPETTQTVEAPKRYTNAWEMAKPSQTQIPKKQTSPSQLDQSIQRRMEIMGLSPGADNTAPVVLNAGGRQAKGAALNAAATAYDVLQKAKAGGGNTSDSEWEQRQADRLQETLNRGRMDDGTPLTDKTRAEILASIERYQNNIGKDNETVAAMQRKADAMTESAQNDIARVKEGATGIEKFLIDTTAAAVPLAGDVVAGAIVPGAGLAMMGARAFGSGAQKARQEGASLDQQLLYGGATAATEVLTEKISNIAEPFKQAFGGGWLDDAIISKAASKFASSAIGKAAMSAGGEAFEEMLSDAIEPMTELIYKYGDEPTALAAMKRSYGENFSWSDMLYDGLVGGALGIVGGAVDVVNQRSATDAADAANALREQDNAARAEIIRQFNEAQEARATETAETAPVVEKNQQVNTTENVETESVRPAQKQAETAAATVSENAALNMQSVGEAAATLGTNGSKALRNSYNADIASTLSAPDAYRGFTTLYDSVRTGSELTAEQQAAVDKLPQSMQLAARASAERDMQAATQVKYFKDAGFQGERPKTMSYRTYRTIDTVAKALGVKVQYVENLTDSNGKAVNGEYKDGVIRISSKAENPAAAVFSHEVVHRIRQTAPDAYAAMVSFVQSNLQNTGDLVDVAYRVTYGTNDIDAITEEKVADAFSTILQDEQTMNEFAKQHRTAAERLLDAVNELIDKIKAALGTKEMQMDDAQRALFRELQGQTEEMSRLLTKALGESEAAAAASKSASVANENATDDGGVKYSKKVIKDSVDSDGNQLTEEQIEYFRNSKVRDENGNLKVMYHGTANDFTVFDPFKQGGKNGTAEGYGIYFADSTEVTDAYGGKTLKGYVNMTRPARSDAKTIKRTELVKVIRETCTKEAQQLVDDGDYSNIKEALRDTWISNYVDTYSQPINSSYAEVAQSILSMNDSDMGIVQEIMTGMGIRSYQDAYAFYDTLTSVTGIDGFMTEWENRENPDDPRQIVVAFNSEQFKRQDNLTPTESKDIRYSRKVASKEDLARIMKEVADAKAATAEESMQIDATDPRNVKRYQNEVSDVLAGKMPSNKMVFMGMPSRVLSDHMNADNPLYMPQSAVTKVTYKDKALGGKHGLGREVLDQMLYEFEDPMAITGNTSRHVAFNDKSIVVWTDWASENGDSIIVPIRIDAKGSVGLYNNVNTAFDAFNEEYVADLLRDGNILYTRNNENIRSLLAQQRQVLKWESDTDVSNANVSQDDKSVKRSRSIKSAAQSFSWLLEDQGRLAGQMAQGREDAEKLRKTKEKLAKEKARRETEVQEMKEHARQVRENRAARKADSAERTKLLHVAQRLQRIKVDRPTRALINELIGELDTVSKGMTGKTFDNLFELHQWYAEQARNDPDFIRDAAIEDRLDRLGKVHINGDMTIEQVRALTDALLNIENNIRSMRKFIDSQERRATHAAADQIIKDVRSTKGSGTSKAENIADWLQDNHLSPLRLINRLTGYKKSSPLYTLVKEINDGQRKMIDFQMRASHLFDKWTNNAKFIDSIRGKNAQTVDVTGIENGETVTVPITRDMVMALYLHSLNDQNLKHIRKGGVTIPDLKILNAGKVAEAYDRGHVIKLSPSAVRGLALNLTAEERAFANEAKKYFNGMSQEEINAVSEKLVGYSIAGVENYFPINTDTRFSQKEFESLKMDGTIEGMGFLKERQDAANPIMLRGMTDVLNQSIRQTSKYVGLAIPVRNFGKVWGTSEARFDNAGNVEHHADAVQKAVTNQWGERGAKYIEKMMTDIQTEGGSTEELDQWLGKARSAYAGATLTLNAGVALKQAASYPTAGAVVGGTPLAKALPELGRALVGKSTVDTKLIEKYTPLLWYRSQGFSTTELGNLATAGKQMPKWLNWIQAVDIATTKALWKAAEYYVQGNNKALAVGSDAYYRTVADVYNRIIEETQPNYTTMQRPQILRSDSSLVQSITMFKTQPMQNFNILYDAAGNLIAKANENSKNSTPASKAAVKEAQTEFSRAAISQVAQLFVFAAMTAAWKGLRKKDDDYRDDEGELTAGSVGKQIGKDMVSGLASMVLFGSEAYNALDSVITGSTYYGIDSVSVSAISDMASGVIGSINNMRKLVADVMDEDTDVEWLDYGKKLFKNATDISKITGIPVKNFTDICDTILHRSLLAGMGKYEGEYAYMKFTTPHSSAAKYYDLLFRTILKDQKAYEAIRADMIANGFDESKIDSAIKDRRKKANAYANEFAAQKAMLEDNRLYQSMDKAAQYDVDMWLNRYEAAVDRTQLGERFALEGVNQRLHDSKIVEPWEYALFVAAKKLVDSEGNNNGSYDTEEINEALKRLGYSNKVSDAIKEINKPSKKK